VIHPTARVHPTADIEDDVDVGAGTRIWHRAHVRTGARIGSQCVIGGGVYIDAGVPIGDRVKIQSGALVYHGVTVADDVFIGPGAILTNDRFPRATTPDGGLATEADWQVAPIRLERGCSIGAGAVVVAGCDVGSYALVGAGAVVTRSVPAHALVAGNPARRIGWVCGCGQRLADATGHDAPAVRDRYAIDRELVCPACARRYAFAVDAEALEERHDPSVPQGANA
jgi:UDP-2-acetamido-3-amino-2,3-dideoxy-glucuronate N-acetyltransferase